ncbi:TonB-dependent receptor [Aliiglaciecola sp. LCG003]|uniref:TonB-dependent receptor n=1 Tax=Aliiglaciecola sp. LCG003 TaxID=3053655 RepID=UPI002573EE5F|nr:TonB-dependent receptor [Aliiglaciecola sp. LCG003]WJG11020.1 TonB-dependent receptor [Aliiglaciecola sp. LCG003]
MRHTKIAEQLGSKALLVALSVTPFAANADTTDCEKLGNAAQQQECKVNQDETKEIELVEVYGMAFSPYRVTRSGDMRRGADLADTPQTMTILTQSQILDSGKSDLKEILASQSGVTIGTGENGNAFGDRYIIRGHEARSDVFVDGLRDPGMTTRESFATEQVEITKGPSSTFAGRGSSGGAVNSITKQASPNYNFNRLDASVGTDDHYRVVVDSNVAINTDSAVRLNVLSTEETVPNRDGIERSRQGVLLSGFHAPTDKLSFIADAYYLNAEDVPDLGSYFDRTTRQPISDIPVYAQNEDFLDTEVKALTLRTEYEFSDSLKFYNATRWGKTSNGYITTGVSGAVRDVSDETAPGADTLRISNHQGWQDVDYLATQFNFFLENNTFGFKNQWVFGLDYSHEQVDNGVYNIDYLGETNCRVGGRRGVSDSYCILDGSGNILDNARSLMQRDYSRGDSDAKADVETTALYIMNNMELNDEWNVFFGIRHDRYDYENTVNSRGTLTYFDYSDGFTNGHLGLVYNLTDEGNVYLTYSTASNINGGESDVGGSCGYGGLCGSPEQVDQSDPERVNNIELGTKWQLFDQRLLATAAYFEITKSDVMESVGDDYSTLGTLNTGKNRVKGIEVSLSGAITDELSIQLSASMMDSEILESHSEDSIGLALSNFADDSLYVQLRYQPNDTWAFGTSYTYKSEMFGGQPDTAAGYSQEAGEYSIVVPSYSVVDIFANYYYSNDVNFRLNVGNVFDKEYWTAAYRSGSFMYLGEARSVRASVTWNF